MKKDDYMEFIKKYLRNRKFRSKIDKNQFIYLDGLIIQNNKEYIIEREDGSGITLSAKGKEEILNITVGIIRCKRESKDRLLRYYNRLFETKTLATIENSTECVCEGKKKSINQRNTLMKLHLRKTKILLKKKCI